jgi:hypothetical protein
LGILFGFGFLDVKVDIEALSLELGQMPDWKVFVDIFGRFFEIIQQV